MEVIVSALVGGVVRGLVGFVKHQYSYKDVKFEVRYFVFMVLVSGAVGTVAALAARELFLTAATPAFALVVGYAGGDFLEGVGKVLLKRHVS